MAGLGAYEWVLADLEAQLKRVTAQRDAMLNDIRAVRDAVLILTEACEVCGPDGYCGLHGRILSLLNRWVEVT